MTLEMISDAGISPGITLRPGTQLSLVEPYLELVDLVLVMSVEPGFGGQGFIPASFNRISSLRRSIDSNDGCSTLISVDGGVKLHNAGEILAAGADIFVAGSAIFGTDAPADTIRQFKAID